MADKIIATITSKGQITVPAQHRKAWGLKPGDQIAFDPPSGKSVRIEPRRKRGIFERLDELKLPSLGRPAYPRGHRKRDHGGHDREASAVARDTMIGLDTNVLLRLGDDDAPRQRDRARALVRSQGENGSFVNAIFLAEFAWTLTRFYNLSRGEAAARIAVILESPEFVVASFEEASRAVQSFREGPADFADCFLAEINASAGCATTATFDSVALKSGEPFAPVPTPA